MISIYSSIFFVVLNNFKISSSFLMTDILYTFLAFYFLYKLKKFQVTVLFKPLFYLSFFIFVSIINYIFYENSTSLLSQFRFIWGLLIFWVFYIYFHQSLIRQETLFKAYLFFCTYCSIFILLQNILFHVFKVNVFITFGEFDLIRNSMDGATSGLDSMVRSGGFFREPSWYAIFMMPAIYMLFELKDYRRLIILILGILLCTSVTGFVYLCTFLFSIAILSSSIKLKLYSILLIILMPIILYWAFLTLPFIFERLIYVFENGGGGSAETRIFEPFKHFYDNISFFGVDVTFLKDNGNVFFVNTFLYVFFSFGMVGTMVFLKLLISFKLRFIFLSISLLFAVVIEGLAGRIDFWIIVLICQFIYNQNFHNFVYNQNNN